MNHIKQMWGHYLALVLVLVVLIFPISWIYQLIRHRYGADDAALALVVISMAIITFGIWGGNQAWKLHRFVRAELARRAKANAMEEKPVVFELFGIELFQSVPVPAPPQPKPVETNPNPGDDLGDLQDLITATPRKRRGKQPRYPEAKIRSAVLRWERRDPSFSARTLEEFLEDEFGCGPDGILLVATSTFYDWRRNILKEITEQHKNAKIESP